MKLSTHTLAVLGILILALLVRLIHLNGSLWLDEAAQALESARPLSEQLQIQEDFQPPLYHLILHFWMYGGMSEWWLRLTSLISGLITIIVTIRLGTKLFDAHTGLLAGAFMATSQFHAFFSQELRPYSVAAMFGLIMLDGLISAWNHKRFAWIQFGLAALAGLYTMYVFPFLILATLVTTMIFHRDSIKPHIITLIVVTLAYVPWLPSFYGQLTTGTNLSAQSTVWSEMVSPPVSKMLPLLFTKFLIGRIPIDLNLKDIVMVGLMVAVTLFVVARSFHKQQGKQVFTLLSVSILSTFLISLVIPVLDAKRVLYALPLVYLLLAAGIGKGVQSIIATLIILGINVVSINEYATNPEVQREPWRQAVAQVEVTVPDTTLVVFSFTGPFAPWQWYQTRNLTTISIPNPQAQPEEVMWLAAAAQRVDQVVVFEYLMDMTDPNRVIHSSLEQNGLTETGYLQFPGIGKIRRFEPTNPVAFLQVQ